MYTVAAQFIDGCLEQFLRVRESGAFDYPDQGRRSYDQSTLALLISTYSEIERFRSEAGKSLETISELARQTTKRRAPFERALKDTDARLSALKDLLVRTSYHDLVLKFYRGRVDYGERIADTSVRFHVVAALDFSSTVIPKVIQRGGTDRRILIRRLRSYPEFPDNPEETEIFENDLSGNCDLGVDPRADLSLRFSAEDEMYLRTSKGASVFRAMDFELIDVSDSSRLLKAVDADDTGLDAFDAILTKLYGRIVDQYDLHELFDPSR